MSRYALAAQLSYMDAVAGKFTRWRDHLLAAGEGSLGEAEQAAEHLLPRRNGFAKGPDIRCRVWRHLWKRHRTEHGRPRNSWTGSPLRRRS